MSEHIEQRLLRLAEAATPAFGVFQKALGATGLSADAAFIAALSPATVSRLARVVEAARVPLAAMECRICIGPSFGHRAGCALLALDAEREGREGAE